MAAELTEDQTLIVGTAREYAQDKLRPNAARWEHEGLDRGVLQELAGLGFAGIYVGEEHGGSGLTRLDAAMQGRHGAEPPRSGGHHAPGPPRRRWRG